MQTCPGTTSLTAAYDANPTTLRIYELAVRVLTYTKQ